MVTLPHEYQFNHVKIPTPDGEIFVIDEGPKEAPVLLCLHGNPTWGFYFRKIISSFRNSMRVVVPDHLGMGLSDNLKGKQLRAVDRVAHLNLVLDYLKIDKFSLCMHDWGGPIGTKLAAEKPERIEKLIYFNTTLTETLSLPNFIKAFAGTKLGKFCTFYTPIFLKFLVTFGTVRKLSKEAKKGYLLPYRNKSSREAIWHFVRDIPMHEKHASFADAQELAKQIEALSSVPTLILWGIRDPCFHRGILHTVTRHFPDAEVKELSQASHLPLEDEPEICISEIQRFLGREVTPASHSRHPLVHHFENQAAGNPALTAVVDVLEDQFTKYSYSDLHKEIISLANSFAFEGVRAGHKVLILTPPSKEFLTTSFAVMSLGAIPVFLDPGIGLENIKKCLRDASVDGFIGSLKAHALRIVARKELGSLKYKVLTDSNLPLPGTLRLKHTRKKAYDTFEVESNGINHSTGLIAFTSGATGTPKGVIFSFDMLEDQLRIIREALNQKEGDIDLPLLPVFSLFNFPSGITSVFGLTDVSNPISLNPERVANAVQSLGITSSFGSPTLWNKISSYCEKERITLPSLKRVFLAGCGVPLQTLKSVMKVACNAEVATPYGATEALPITYISGDEVVKLQREPSRIFGTGTPVGRAISGLEVKIIDEELMELPPFEVGEIAATGQNVSREYLNREEATKLSKFKTDDGRVWHKTGDLGYTDSNGMLYYMGRKVHKVEGKNGVFLSEPVEIIFNTHPKIFRSALFLKGENAAVALQPHQWPLSIESRGTIIEEVRALAEQYAFTSKITEFYFLKDFPVDARHNAKIFRDRIAPLIEEKE